MYFGINIHPNLPNEKIVLFSAHLQLSGEDDLKNFDVKIEGYIPENDSVSELRLQAREKAKAILTEILKAFSENES